MTSRRQQHRRAAGRGLSSGQLELVDMLEEMLERLRWQEILAHANQFLMTEKLQVSKQERDRILEASTRAVDRDGKLHQWRERLGRLKGELHRRQQTLGEEKERGAAGD